MNGSVPTSTIPRPDAASETDAPLRERVRQQFDDCPYPGNERPIELEKLARSYGASCLTAFYVRDGSTAGRDALRILDVGCGSGPNALAMAIANPGSEVVGVDFSTKSVDEAERRRREADVPNARFQHLSLERLGELEGEFDFITCSDVLYLLDDPVEGLVQMSEKLAPHGILRSNLHNLEHRRRYLRAQKLMSLLGVSQLPTEEAVRRVREVYHGFTDRARLRSQTWRRNFERSEGALLANHLLLGDKGFTLDQVFEVIEAAQLELVDMVDRVAWNPDFAIDLSSDEGQALSEQVRGMSRKDQLRFYELVNHQPRLFDFWCCKPGALAPRPTLEDWGDDAWGAATVELHPSLRSDAVLRGAFEAVETGSVWNLAPWVPYLGENFWLPARALEVFTLIGDERRSVPELEERWHLLHPYGLPTMEPRSPAQSNQRVRDCLATLDRLGAVFVQPGDDAGA